MNFEAIENLSSEELAILYDDVIEGGTNIAQCACGVDGTCKGDGGDDPNNKKVCIFKTNLNSTNYVTADECRDSCLSECGTTYFLHYNYRQSSCYGSGVGSAYAYPCIKNDGNGSYTHMCR